MSESNPDGRFRQRVAFSVKEKRTEALSCEFWEETLHLRTEIWLGMRIDKTVELAYGRI